MESLDKPITITTSKTIASFTIQNVVVGLNTTACINIALYDALGDNIGNKSFIMEPIDYAKWGTDDSYIIEYVKQKLALINTL